MIIFAQTSTTDDGDVFLVALTTKINITICLSELQLLNTLYASRKYISTPVLCLTSYKTHLDQSSLPLSRSGLFIIGKWSPPPPPPPANRRNPPLLLPREVYTRHKINDIMIVTCHH
jgi:hypothetical protein